MHNTVRFILDGEKQEVLNPDPTLTVLNYLRYAVGRTGTKEGCAEGDCGACTMVLRELNGSEIAYRAVNACILFLPMIDGKELLTIESLTPEENNLHPVQKAMIAHHGSQCGFCTPGIIMSLYAMCKVHDEISNETINNSLAGNLCRCTGYGPIINAAQAIEPHLLQEDESQRLQILQKLKRTSSLELAYKCSISHQTRRYYAPQSIEELEIILGAHPEAILLSGGTDIGLWVTKQNKTLTTLVSLEHIPELMVVEDKEDSIILGSGVRYTQTIDLLTHYFPDFGEVIRRIGSVQIRNSGTIGGNIGNGSPIGDTSPILIALNATLTLRRNGSTRTLPIEDFFIDYGRQDLNQGEFIESIHIPKLRATQILKAYKISKRFDQDISAVCAGFLFSLKNDVITDIRIAFGGMAATPKRAMHTEAALRGKTLSEENISLACSQLDRDFAPISDMRASAEYRLQVAKNLLHKAYIEIDQDQPIRLVPELKDQVHV